jgi:hypothetical protein
MKTEPNNFTPLTARPLPAGSVLRHPRQRPGRSSSLRCGRCAWTPAAGAARPNTPETTRKNGHNDHKTRLDWFRRFRDDPADPTQNPAGGEGNGGVQIEPTSNPPAKSVPDAAATDGVQRGPQGRCACLHDKGPDPSSQIRACSWRSAGQGFEPWKASADGFTVRLMNVFLGSLCAI